MNFHPFLLCGHGVAARTSCCTCEPTARHEARLGIVVGKKFAPRAAERNLVKRMARELFRGQQAQLAGRDILLRLQAKFPRADFASRTAVRQACLAEIAGLLEVAARPLPTAPPAVDTAGPAAPATPNAPA